MNDIIFKEEIHHEAYSILKDSIKKISEEKEKIILGLPGGRNIQPILKFFKKRSILFDRTHVFMTDERLVPLNDPDSNFGLIKNCLVGVLPEENFHPFILHENKQNYGLTDYKNEIKKFGGSYDIVVVSAGEDGHIASLYPDHPSIKNESENYILINDSPKPPKQRISMSKNMFLRSKIGILLFAGEGKRDSYKNFLDDKINFVKCPAKLTLELLESYVLTNIKI
jgi:6-phosphogluconolactonase